MQEEHNPHERHAPVIWLASEDADLPRRRSLLRRLRVLLMAGVVAFALTTWMLVRVENPAALLGLSPGPASVARAHLAALNHGELRTAYDFFSAKYRQQVSFEAYHRLVVSHREMFRTEVVEFETQEAGADRAVLESHITSADGAAYVARFTMVRREGRWWIDDLRWGLVADEDDFIRV